MILLSMEVQTTKNCVDNAPQPMQEYCRLGPHMRTTLFAVFISIVVPSLAHAYCSEPSAPSCATRFGAFDDEWEFDRCKRDMESYKSDVESYMSCRNDEAQQAINEANRDNERAGASYSDAVSSFNRRARGY